jgi:hypothetical protein
MVDIGVIVVHGDATGEVSVGAGNLQLNHDLLTEPVLGMLCRREIDLELRVEFASPGQNVGQLGVRQVVCSVGLVEVL